MNVRKLTDWRKILIYSHRWMGIFLGVLFVVWCVSGIVLMYVGLPRLTVAERLMRMDPLDLSTVAITPTEAAYKAGLSGNRSPARLRVAMHGDRPVYRLNRGPTWTVVYADTGEPLKPIDADEAKRVLGRFLSESASSLRYDAYLTTPDLFTMDSPIRPHLPLHRFALDDGAGTKYYVSETTGETVMRTDTMSRFLGFSGYALHRLTFMKQYSWWSPFFKSVVWVSLLMCVTGLVVGIWRFGLSARFRQKGVPSHSPYAGWMKWHHYAGLIVGLFTFTWMLSGTMIALAIPGITAPFFGGGRLNGTEREFITGGSIDMAPITVEGLRGAVAAIAGSFPPKELEFLQFGGEPYFVSYRAPSPDEAEEWISTSLGDFAAPALDQEHLIVSATAPDQGAFSRFDDDAMMEIARRTMPGVPIRDATWLNDYDAYYYKTIPTFNSAALKAVRPLPVLRVRFEDATQTVLYLAPTHGQVSKYAREDRLKRWGYFSLHALDFSFLLNRRPLWDIVTALLLAGGALVSATTLLPMFRRLKRHGRRIWRWMFPQRRPKIEPASPMDV